jgi:hypothetical protein
MLLKTHPPAALFSHHVEPRIEPIRLAAGLGVDDFQRNYAPHFSRACRHLQRLPLCPDGYNLPDGAVRFAVDASLLALQLAQASVFASDEGSRLRRELLPQFRFAVFAGILGIAYIRVFRHVRVQSDGRRWNPMSESPLYEFAAATGSYEIAWAPADDLPQNVALDAMVFTSAFPPGYWERFHPRVLHEMTGSLSPARDVTSESPMRRLLRTAMEKTFEREATRIAENIAEGTQISVAEPTAPATLDEHGGISNLVGDEKNPSPEKPRALYPKTVTMLFDAMRADDAFDEIKKAIEITPTGVSIPLKYLNRYGMRGTYCKQLLESVNLVVSSNEKHVVLQPEVSEMLGLTSGNRSR